MNELPIQAQARGLRGEGAIGGLRMQQMPQVSSPGAPARPTTGGGYDSLIQMLTGQGGAAPQRKPGMGTSTSVGTPMAAFGQPGAQPPGQRWREPSREQISWQGYNPGRVFGAPHVPTGGPIKNGWTPPPNLDLSNYRLDSSNWRTLR